MLGAVGFSMKCEAESTADGFAQYCFAIEKLGGRFVCAA